MTVHPNLKFSVHFSESRSFFARSMEQNFKSWFVYWEVGLVNNAVGSVEIGTL
jgi:hypothetical protein